MEVGIGFAYHSDSRLHIFELAFVHRDGGTLKPATLAQVSGEVAQEGQPVVAVGGVLRTGVDKFHRIGSLVVVVELQRPGYHGVAVDGAGDAHLAGHELYPAVKHGVVVFPLSVDGQRALYHAAEGVFGLSVPGVVHDAGSDGLLAGVGKHLHHGEHGVEVLAACEHLPGVAQHHPPTGEADAGLVPHHAYAVVGQPRGTVEVVRGELAVGHAAQYVLYVLSVVEIYFHHRKFNAFSLIIYQ